MKNFRREQRIGTLYTELETTENSVTAYKLQQELECEGGFQRYADRVPGTAGRRKIPPSPEGCTIYTFIYQYTLVAFGSSCFVCLLPFL